jgi:hypothetical protein
MNFARLIRGDKFVGTVAEFGNSNPGTGSSGPIRSAMGYETFNMFAVRLRNLPEMGGSVDLLFTRSGLVWKLTGLRPVTAQNDTSAAARLPQLSPSPELPDKTATAQKYLAMLKSESGGYDPRAFLALRDIEAGVSKFFEKEPKIATPDGEIDMESNFTNALNLPEEGFPKVVDDTVILAGCAPHACNYGQSFLSVSLTGKAMQAAHFEQGGQNGSRITLYGVGSLQAASAAMQEWVNTRKSDTPITVQVAR